MGAVLHFTPPGVHGPSASVVGDADGLRALIATLNRALDDHEAEMSLQGEDGHPIILKVECSPQ